MATIVPNRILSLFIAVTAVLLLGMGAAPKDPQITIEHPSASLSGMFIGAGSVFMTIRNTGGRDTLLSASVPFPRTLAELHDVKNNRMFRVERVAIPARDAVELKPRGLHIMIFNMPSTVKEGSEVILTLKFERSGEKHVPIRFGREDGMQDMRH